jgi:hypothetical protein
MEFSRGTEIAETKNPESKGYREIKPESDMTVKEARGFWDKVFGNKEADEKNSEVFEKDLEKVTEEYFKDLRDKSEFADTIPEKSFEISDLKKISPEERAEMREEFEANKDKLIRQWEEKNDCSWPTYKEDVYITTKTGERVKIQKAGDRYDMHHLQPLSVGGKNEVSNITPLHVDVHRDHRGIHVIDGSCDRMCKMVGGMEK